MPIAFFVSSVGDTDLAIATISEMLAQGFKDKVFLIHLTNIAEKRTDNLKNTIQVVKKNIYEIFGQKEFDAKKQVEADELEKVAKFIEENKVHRAYIGVPSPNDEEIPFQIASSISIPCTIAYEFMFKPQAHSLWKHADVLASKEGCNFAVPLASSAEDIQTDNPKATVSLVGHLSIDRALNSSLKDTTAIKKSLLIPKGDELAFISGTTQPLNIDNSFLESLLKKLNTGNYPNLQIRFGIHPGVKDFDEYTKTLLTTCKRFPKTQSQFRIILPDNIEARLKNALSDEYLHLLRCNISGPDAAAAADKVAQAVPGAPLNEAALRGKVSYYHDASVKPYLPKKWFASDLCSFFSLTAQKPHSRNDLGLDEDSPKLMASLMMK